MPMFRNPEFSHWKIAGSAGVDVQVQTPGLEISIGGAYLQLPLENARTQETVTLHMAGLGLGLGVGFSALGIVDIEGSLSHFPSKGIGRLIYGPRGSSYMTSRDFENNVVIASGVGAKFYGGASVVALAFIKGDILTRLMTGILPGQADDIALWSHAYGLFYGASVGLGGSAGFTFHKYRVVTTV